MVFIGGVGSGLANDEGLRIEDAEVDGVVTPSAGVGRGTSPPFEGLLSEDGEVPEVREGVVATPPAIGAGYCG